MVLFFENSIPKLLSGLSSNPLFRRGLPILIERDSIIYQWPEEKKRFLAVGKQFLLFKIGFYDLPNISMILIRKKRTLPFEMRFEMRKNLELFSNDTLIQ